MSVYDVKPAELIEKTAQELKKIIKQPEWSMFIKTGVGKSRPPENTDWFYMRAAAVFRKVCMAKGPIGVNKLRTKFGSRKDRGVKPEKFRSAGGKIIRNILQQLEKNKLIVQKTIGVHKGRVATKEGMALLEKSTKT